VCGKGVFLQVSSGYWEFELAWFQISQLPLYRLQKISVIWDISPCSSVKCQPTFKRTYRLNFQFESAKLDTIHSFEKSVDFHWTTRCCLCTRRHNSPWPPLWEHQMQYSLQSFLTFWGGKAFMIFIVVV
jgi:hypothetical protein